MGRTTILIVDDHEVIRDGIQHLLQYEEDFEVVGKASDAREALNLVESLSPDIILMDEPASALDPISTGKIEETINDLKTNYTIVIVTHNMQQAARVSDYTAFMMVGELVEFDKTDIIFTNPNKKLTEEYITGRFG